MTLYEKNRAYQLEIDPARKNTTETRETVDYVRWIDNNGLDRSAEIIIANEDASEAKTASSVFKNEVIGDAMKKLIKRVNAANDRFTKACKVLSQEETKTIEYLIGYWDRPNTQDALKQASDAIREQSMSAIDTEHGYRSSEIERAKKDFYRDIKEHVNLEAYQTFEGKY